MNTFEQAGIFPTNSSGQQKLPCPKCSSTRKKPSDPCLSVNITEGVWNCHHCGWNGSVKKVNKLTIDKPIIKPTPPKTDLPENVYKWFEDRGITRAVVNEAKMDTISILQEW